MVNSMLQLLGLLLFPPVCVLCGGSAHGERLRGFDLCHGCFEDLPINERACTFCAQPLPSEAPNNLVCGQCLMRRPKFHSAFCAYRYAYPIDHLVRALKFHGRVAYGRVLGELLTDALLQSQRASWPEILIPMPLAKDRFGERGFNQSIELGRIVESRLGIPLRTDLTARTRNTREQTGLDQKARRKNVRGAFTVAAQFRAKHVAILDDVMTTGSTANELARMLRRAGAKRIEVWAVARTAR